MKEEDREILTAKAEMKRFKEKGNRFGYKQAKAHYERLIRKKRLNERSAT